MKLRSPEILLAFMRQKNFSMARLARYAGCSKGFISHLLADPPRKTSCSKDLADKIAEALDVPTLALFDARTSAVSGDDERDERISA